MMAREKGKVKNGLPVKEVKTMNGKTEPEPWYSVAPSHTSPMRRMNLVSGYFLNIV